MALTHQNWSSSTPCDNTIFINTSYKLQQNALFHEEWLVTWTLVTTNLRIAKDAIPPNIAPDSFIGDESRHETLNPIDSWSSKPTCHKNQNLFLLMAILNAQLQLVLTTGQCMIDNLDQGLLVWFPYSENFGTYQIHNSISQTGLYFSFLFEQLQTQLGPEDTVLAQMQPKTW